MHFEYEITREDYIAAQKIYWKQTYGKKLIRRSVWYFLLGLFFIIVPVSQQQEGWVALVIVAIGVWLIYCALMSLFPNRYLRGQYANSELAGKRYYAEVGQEGFEVKGDVCGWQVTWGGVTTKGEDEQTFMLAGANTIFIWGKRNLTLEQQQELHRLAIEKPVPNLDPLR